MIVKIFSYLMAAFFIFGSCALAQSIDYQKLLDYLDSKFPASYQVVSQVAEKYQDRLTIPIKEKPLSRGQELVVLSQKKGVPVYLLPQAAVIRVESSFQEKVLAQEVKKLGQSINIEDPVALPASPIIYLLTNVADKEAFLPYQKLVQAILDNNYELVELSEPKIRPYTDRYGVLIRLEGLADHLVVKIQSIYSGDTFYSKSWPTTRSFKTERQAGLRVAIGQAYEPSPKVQKPEEEKEIELSYKIPKAEKEQGFLKAKAPTGKFFRLAGNYSRFVICQLDGKGQQEFVFLNNKGVKVQKMVSDQLRPLIQYRFQDQGVVALHLHAMDINRDNRDELIVTLGKENQLGETKDTSLSSLVLSYQNDGFQLLSQNLPYYLRVIEDRAGHKVLIGQKKGQYDPYTGKIYRLTWDNMQEVFMTEPYPPAANIYSLYQFNLISDDLKRVMILEPYNQVSVYYTPTEEMEFLANKAYGDFETIPFCQELEKPKYLGGFNEKKTYKKVYASRRFVLKHEYDQQSFLINKERQSGEVLEKIQKFIQGNKNAEDNLVGLKWNGQYVQETWRSESLAKDILDFSFYDHPEEDKLYVLVRDMQGFAVQRIR